MSPYPLRSGVLVLAVAGLVMAGCSDSPDSAPEAAGLPSAVATSAEPSPVPEGEPRTVEAARAAAEREFSAYAAGDWAGAWDLWTAAGQTAISREEYVRLHTECGTLTGPLFEITNARLEGDDRAIVTFERVIAAGTAVMLYEDGAWRYQPDDDAMADYAKGVDQALADRRAEGGCDE